MYPRAAAALTARLALLGVKPRVKWAVVSSRGPALAEEPASCARQAFVCLMRSLTER